MVRVQQLVQQLVSIFRVFYYVVNVKTFSGQIWPKPQKEERMLGQYVAIDPKYFNFLIADHTCDILFEAKNRYEDIIRAMSSVPCTPGTEYDYNDDSNDIPKVKISNFTLNLARECEKYPHLKMDESCKYIVAWRFPAHIEFKPTDLIDILAHEIRAHSIWGMLRGLESFSQLIIPDTNEMVISLYIYTLGDKV